MEKYYVIFIKLVCNELRHNAMTNCFPIRERFNTIALPFRQCA